MKNKDKKVVNKVVNQLDKLELNNTMQKINDKAKD